ncbi:thioesterase II family protein [Actinokineospora bangkokensis]|uniref:Thioesterase domain-containing protein n=1 Tax=Actinokineospora bangkokensis TaxID=1193682 RepID=A0A1Q9LGZ0_9PSEU|nr:thioesterase domain-containing protein [Actinokineospora bangkokensis]OLR91286.1 hypothetical protein BJP25_26840 [Actinokineospora bangkokensis]
MTTPGDPWLRRLRTAPTRAARLVCLPPEGADALFPLPLARAISHPLEVLGVQYPGRRDRRTEPPLTSVEALAEGIATALPGDAPLALFGHGLGALVALEVARRTPAVTLFTSGCPAPSRRFPAHPTGTGPTRADTEAAATYHWSGHPLAIPLTALAGEHDPRAPVDRVAEWHQVTTGPFDLQVFSGDHTYLTHCASTIATAVGERVMELIS